MFYKKDYEQPNNQLPDNNVGPNEEENCLNFDKKNNLCKTCFIGFLLINGKCILNYSFKATFRTEKKNEVILVNKFNLDFIDEMIIDNITLNTTCNYYKFSHPGEHIVYILLYSLSGVTNKIDNLFSGITQMISISFTEKFDTKNIINMNSFFEECSSLVSIDLSKLNTMNLLYTERMFFNCINLISINFGNFNSEKIISMKSMFAGCHSISSIDFSSFKTMNLKNMEYMFSNCHILSSLNLSTFDTKNVNSMYNLFTNCSELTYLNINNFNTKNVEDMSYMFYKCENLISVNFSSFDVQNVKNMERMFSDCRQIKSLDLSNFYTPKLENMKEIFFNCNQLNYLDISLFYSASDREIILYNSVSNYGTIKVESHFWELIKSQFPGWEVLIVNQTYE